MHDTPQLARRDFLKFAGIVGGTALAWNSNLSAQAASKKPAAKPAPKQEKKQEEKDGKACPFMEGVSAYDATRIIEAKTFDNLSTVEGISENQLTQHIGLYQGYVKKINEIQGAIGSASPDLAAANGTYNPYREMHVEQTFALNGAVLHEYYFENIGGQKAQASENLKSLIRKEFGNWDNYINHLMALAKSARGWVITGYNLRDHRIHNYLLDAHNQLVPFYVMPLLVMDVYEHAYMIDFGTKRPAYIEAFLQNLDWSKVEERLDTMLWHTGKPAKA